MASRISNDGLWRVTYGEPNGFTRDELIARQPSKFETMLPGNPKPSDYTLANISPYKVHQRLAESMRVGRFLLAADAAHLCNPMGGLGLTGGIVDVGNLFDCLIGLYEGKADESILTIYSDVRRAKYNEVVNPISSENLVRLFTADPETVLDTDPFFQLCKRAEKDIEFSKELQNVSFTLGNSEFWEFKMLILFRVSTSSSTTSQSIILVGQSTRLRRKGELELIFPTSVFKQSILKEYTKSLLYNCLCSLWK
jgi:hypothetical protein